MINEFIALRVYALQVYGITTQYCAYLFHLVLLSISLLSGVGDIGERPEAIADTWFRLEGWHEWEAYAKDYSIIEVLDKNTTILHFRCAKLNSLL